MPLVYPRLPSFLLGSESLCRLAVNAASAIRSPLPAFTCRKHPAFAAHPFDGTSFALVMCPALHAAQTNTFSMDWPGVVFQTASLRPPTSPEEQ
ncbi:uncharacterized protein SPSK_10331 [Sporothrix schenckii 1099-18]|uniref:Uncharacterized protein n=1 Tax=Sporothrix schenckii 1099-18 TaxID=1397361 RepID=A0A0F2LT93_SPOSC|nr:uncharacterized protein SPSK_10331 [Sporothrix schenckii 1099-18]KJR80074.1 hypothetical protein SPSK_10331 [Sporothrix schenckii 1099-18]